MKADCYQCRHRGTVPGSCHSRCCHPGTKTKLNIRGKPQGVRGGWFSWPVDFDPFWLENCDGFESTKKTQEVPDAE